MSHMDACDSRGHLFVSWTFSTCVDINSQVSRSGIWTLMSHMHTFKDSFVSGIFESRGHL